MTFALFGSNKHELQRRVKEVKESLKARDLKMYFVNTEIVRQWTDQSTWYKARTCSKEGNEISKRNNG